MSNGLFKSPEHRVVIDRERERFSQAVFYYQDHNKYIEFVNELINKTRLKLYMKVKNYHDTYVQHYQKGKRLIEALKI